MDPLSCGPAESDRFPKLILQPKWSRTLIRFDRDDTPNGRDICRCCGQPVAARAQLGDMDHAVAARHFAGARQFAGLDRVADADMDRPEGAGEVAVTAGGWFSRSARSPSGLGDVVDQAAVLARQASRKTVDIRFLLLVLSRARSLHDVLRARNVSPGRLQRLLIADIEAQASTDQDGAGQALSKDARSLLQRTVIQAGARSWRDAGAEFVIETLFEEAGDLFEAQALASLFMKASLDASVMQPLVVREKQSYQCDEPEAADHGHSHRRSHRDDQCEMIDALRERLDRQERVLREIVSLFSELGDTRQAPNAREARSADDAAGPEHSATRTTASAAGRAVEDRFSRTAWRRRAVVASRWDESRSAADGERSSSDGGGGGLAASASVRAASASSTASGVSGRRGRARQRLDRFRRQPRRLSRLWARWRRRVGDRSAREGDDFSGARRDGGSLRFARRSRRRQFRRWFRDERSHSRKSSGFERGNPAASPHPQLSDTRMPRADDRVDEGRAGVEADWADDTEKRFYLSVDDAIVEAPSIGPRTSEYLVQCGVHTVRDLLRADAADLAERISLRQITAERIVDWQDQARLVCAVPWLRGSHAQLLVGAGFRDLAGLLDVDAQAVAAGVLRFAASKAGQRVLRSGPPPELDKILAWIANANEAEPQRAA